MKKPFITITMFMLLLTLLGGMYLFSRCQKDVEPIEEEYEEYFFPTTFEIYGSVENYEKNPVPDAVVRIDGERLVTDETGSFKFRTNRSGTKIIKVRKEGFIDYVDQIFLPEADTFNVIETVYFKAYLGIRADAQSVGPGGGILKFDGVTLAIPENALAQEEHISVTRLKRNGSYPSDQLVLNTFHFEPAGLQFQKEVVVSVDNGFAPFHVESFVYELDTATGEWLYHSDCIYNRENQSCEFELTHFSDWAIVSRPSVSSEIKKGELIAQSSGSTCDSEIGMDVTFSTKKIEGCTINKSVSSEVASKIGATAGNQVIGSVTSEITASISATVGEITTSITEESTEVKIPIPARTTAILKTYPLYKVTTISFVLIYSPSVSAPNETYHFSFITKKAFGVSKELSSERCCPEGQFWCKECQQCIEGDKDEHDCVVHQGGEWVDGECHQGGAGN